MHINEQCIKGRREGTKREYKLHFQRRLKDVLLPFFFVHTSTHSPCLLSFYWLKTVWLFLQEINEMCPTYKRSSFNTSGRIFNEYRKEWRKDSSLLSCHHNHVQSIYIRLLLLYTKNVMNWVSVSILFLVMSANQRKKLLFSSTCTKSWAHHTLTKFRGFFHMWCRFFFCYSLKKKHMRHLMFVNQKLLLGIICRTSEFHIFKLKIFVFQEARFKCQS